MAAAPSCSAGSAFFIPCRPASAGRSAAWFTRPCASYAHQIQHANADLVFWMKRPVHRLHHNHDMKDANFGVLVDWWDRLFGSYRPIEWPRPARRHDLREFFAIPWR